MSFWSWKPYVPVAERRQKALREAEKHKKKGKTLSPVVIQGRTIAGTFWGKAWCENLEQYSDFENRLPRGRTYARNGSVIDLRIEAGEVQALVSGSSLYEVTLKVTPVAKAKWKAICTDCAGGIDSLVELLQGRLSKGVMERICHPQHGLFPAPNELKLSCSCPDWADMCKHVAAVLYGVGSRFDQQPEMLFRLRGVDEAELIASAGKVAPAGKRAPAADKLLGGDLAAMFGLDLAVDSPAPRKPVQAKAPAKAKKKAKAKKTTVKKKVKSRKASG
jgi:uncharacterized Zn finger protein